MVTVEDAPRGGVAHPVELGRRLEQMTAVTRAPNQPGDRDAVEAGGEPLILRQEGRSDRRDELGTSGFDLGESRLPRCLGRRQALGGDLEGGGKGLPLLGGLGKLGLEGLDRLHELELLVLEHAASAAQGGDLSRHRLLVPVGRCPAGGDPLLDLVDPPGQLLGLELEPVTAGHELPKTARQLGGGGVVGGEARLGVDQLGSLWKVGEAVAELGGV
ncbi:MAG: hypothetical protein JWM85_3046 [Acidimicrobiaceae bacterium]|nr:hypothetical protein [Acidimicrobiaceae bacterium]